MIANKISDYLSPEEYLEAEEKSSIKHEYRQGQVYAMAGASNNHVVISLNFASILRNHLRGSGCRTFIADTKVRIESVNTYYYPDIAVSCDRKDLEFENFICYPCLIVEVLSDATEAFDRGDKFADYRQIESLQEYVLVSQTKMKVECFRRNQEGHWVLYPHTIGDTINLASIDFKCSIADLYEDIELTGISDR